MLDMDHLVAVLAPGDSETVRLDAALRLHRPSIVVIVSHLPADARSEEVFELSPPEFFRRRFMPEFFEDIKLAPMPKLRLWDQVLLSRPSPAQQARAATQHAKAKAGRKARFRSRHRQHLR